MNLRYEATALRKTGKSYQEIQSILGVKIPKGTLSYWCKNIVLPDDYIQLRCQQQLAHLTVARRLSQQTKARQRLEYFSTLKNKNQLLLPHLDNPPVAKLILSTLYAAEGSKRSTQKGGTVIFGNSSPTIVSFFLKLLRTCYMLDELKFRCTVQCRADQNEQALRQFWSQQTKIPLTQFYKTQVDPRTKGKPTTKLDYKGVCRLEYFSAAVFWDMMVTAELMMGH